MSWFTSRDLLDRSFEVGIILKGLDGALESIGGILLLLVSPAQINHIVGKTTQHDWPAASPRPSTYSSPC